MRVHVYPTDPWGCGHYRLIWPAQALAAQGHDVAVHPLVTFPALSDGRRIVELRLPDGADHADVHVFQRPTSRPLVALIVALRQAGRTVVVDMDDDLTCVHPRNVAYRLHHPKLSPDNNWEHATRACQVASLVTVSTPELQARYGLRASRVLRNCVPQAYLAVQVDQARPLWGWPGSYGSHPDDLPLLGSAVAELSRRGHEFVIVGSADGTGRALGLDADADATGTVDFQAWPYVLAGLHVGVAPLADSRFNRAKSWLKPLELAAVGVPWVASDIGEYRALADQGAGLLARRPRDWVRHVSRLLGDPDQRAAAGAACRAVAAQLTIEHHAWQWADTWAAAWALDRRPARV